LVVLPRTLLGLFLLLLQWWPHWVRCWLPLLLGLRVPCVRFLSLFVGLRAFLVFLILFLLTERSLPVLRLWFWLCSHCSHSFLSNAVLELFRVLGKEIK